MITTRHAKALSTTLSCLLLTFFWFPKTLEATHAGSSPIHPPNAAPDVFVVDVSPGLDTGCTFRNDGPLEIEIPIATFLGAVDADGHLLDIPGLIDTGVLPSAIATLVAPAFDVDSDADIPGFEPERDQVLFNGVDLGFLTGSNNTWKLNVFKVLVAEIKFPPDQQSSAANDVVVNIDVANVGIGEIWCTALDWVALSLEEVVASQGIVLTGNSADQGIDTDANGLFDSLAVQIEIDVQNAGFYNWSGTLEADDGTQLGFDAASRFLPAGVNSIDLAYDGAAIGSSGFNGPYYVTGLLVFGAGSSLVATQAAVTQAYSACEFETGVCTVADLIGIVSGLVTGGTLNAGQGNALIAKLRAAQAQWDRGNTRAAHNQLGAFINQVNAYLAAGILSPEEAMILLDIAEAIIGA